jgi:hydroxyacylglutathione hydrolase
MVGVVFPVGAGTALAGLIMSLVVEPFICRSDNYGVLVRDEASGETAAIDAPDAEAIRQHLAARGWKLDFIFVTHHHGDHVAGNLALKQETGCTIIGPAKEAGAIPGIDRTVVEGDEVKLGAYSFEVIETPGHTAGHIAYWCKEEGIVFVGDTLFSLGCGRLFEGSPATMWQSLAKLAQLPRETEVYCGHEYTEANARFALTIEPNNLDLEARAEEVRRLREKGAMTLPTTIGQELATNPFLRADRRRVKAAVGLPEAPAAEVFAEIRRRKDAF